MKGKYPNGLGAAMRRKGIGPTALAALANTSKQNIDRWADGSRKLVVEWARKLAPFLDATAEELVFGEVGGGISRVPLLDWVAAGRLTEPRSQIPMEDVPLLAFADLGRGDFFALKVEGTSMNRISPDGSIIVVNRAEREPVSGKCFVFNWRGSTTYKIWHGGDPPYLAPHSWDASHEPIFVKKKNDFEIIGRVRRTLLDL